MIMKNKQSTHSKIPHFSQCLERLFSRVNRPVMSGEICLEVGCSIAQVVFEMELLCDSGKYKIVEPEELKKRGMEPRVLAYARV
jgi:hypothetical protein